MKKLETQHEHKFNEFREILNGKDEAIVNLKVDVENIKKASVPTTNEVIGHILEAVNASIQENVVVALEPLIKNQTQSERRVNCQFSDLETQIAAISQVLNQNTFNQQFQCDLCRRAFQNHRSLQNHRRTCHQPYLT